MSADLNEIRHIIPLLIPIVAILTGVVVVVVVLALDYKKKSQWLEMHHRERMAAIERGLEVPPLPPEFFQSGGGSGSRRREPGSALRRGLVFLLVGLGLAAALAINRDIESAAWSLIPIAIGLANLLFHRLDSRA